MGKVEIGKKYDVIQQQGRVGNWVNEFWIARENLSKPGARTDLTSSKSGQGYTWSGYCEDIGVPRSSVDNWLKRWFPESLTLERKPLIKFSDYKNWLKEQEQCDLLLTDPPYMTKE